VGKPLTRARQRRYLHHEGRWPRPLVGVFEQQRP